MQALGMVWAIDAPKGVTAPPFALAADAALWGYKAFAGRSGLTPPERVTWPLEGAPQAILVASGPSAGQRPNGRQTCGVYLVGALDNERALRRRLIAASRADVLDTASDLVGRLFEIYAARFSDPAALMRAIAAHLVGDYAIIALTCEHGAPRLMAMHQGHPLWLGRTSDHAIISSARLTQSNCDLTRLQKGDLVLAHADHVSIVDSEGMRIERHLGEARLNMRASRPEAITIEAVL